MDVIEIQDGYATLRIHWIELDLLARAVQAFEGSTNKEWHQTRMIHALFETAAFAGRAQLMSVKSERLTLETVREEALAKRDAA